MTLGVVDQIRTYARDEGNEMLEGMLAIVSAAALGVWFGIEYARRTIFIETNGAANAALFAPARWADHPINAPVPIADAAFWLAFVGLLSLGAIGLVEKRRED